MGGDPILTIIMYICSVHFRFLGEILNKDVYSIHLVFFKLFPSPSLCKYGIKFRSPWSSSVVLVIVVLIVICLIEVFWCFFNLEICIGQ